MYKSIYEMLVKHNIFSHEDSIYILKMIKSLLKKEKIYYLNNESDKRDFVKKMVMLGSVLYEYELRPKEVEYVMKVVALVFTK